MHTRLYDRHHNLLATANIEWSGDSYTGTADTAEMPAELRWTFERYEKLVDDGVHSMIDIVQGEIAKLDIFSMNDDGVIMMLDHVQLFPRAGKVSFRPAIQLTF